MHLHDTSMKYMPTKRAMTEQAQIKAENVIVSNPRNQQNSIHARTCAHPCQLMSGQCVQPTRLLKYMPSQLHSFQLRTIQMQTDTALVQDAQSSKPSTSMCLTLRKESI